MCVNKLLIFQNKCCAAEKPISSGVTSGGIFRFWVHVNLPFDSPPLPTVHVIGLTHTKTHPSIHTYRHIIYMPIPVLRRRDSLGVTGQSGLLLDGFQGDEKVARLHPPSWAVERPAVETNCQETVSSPPPSPSADASVQSHSQ